MPDPIRHPERWIPASAGMTAARAVRAFNWRLNSLYLNLRFSLYLYLLYLFPVI